MHGDIGTGQQRCEPRGRRLGDENLPHGAVAQRSLDQIRPLGEELAGPLARDVPVQLGRGRDP
jgi:hypothetical protein